MKGCELIDAQSVCRPDTQVYRLHRELCHRSHNLLALPLQGLSGDSLGEGERPKNLAQCTP
jgi:hypothetical protein